MEYDPETFGIGGNIADFGEGVRRRIREWFEKAQEEIFRRMAKTYHGEQQVHELLERTTWHAGQHLMPIYRLLEQHRFLPANSLPEAVFEGLPMPGQLWWGSSNYRLGDLSPYHANGFLRWILGWIIPGRTSLSLGPPQAMHARRGIPSATL